MRKREKMPTHQDLMVAAQATANPAAWLLEFANRDLAVMTPEEAEDRLWEIVSFAYPPGGTPLRPDTKSPVNRRPAGWAGKPPLPSLSANVDVRTFQQDVRQALSSLVEGGGALRELPAGLHGVQRQKDGTYEVIMAGTTELAFFGRVFQLLAALAPRLRRCPAPNCGRFFAVIRRQAYCSPQCSGRVRIQRFRGAHPNRLAEIRRKSYEKRQKRIVGKNVRVARHPRKTKRTPR